MSTVVKTKMKTIRLRAKEERRFKSGHPWVFSNELQESPKNLEFGELIELCDAGGAFLAYGFGNPHSLISFRELTRDAKTPHIENGELNVSFFVEAFKQALKFRTVFFKLSESFRMVYGEADGLSGLIVDRFAGAKAVVYVVQPHASGMDRNLNLIEQALTKLAKENREEQVYVILRRDASSREKEGLAKEAPAVIGLSGEHAGKMLAAADASFLSAFEFLVPSLSGESIAITCDLISGQKTGFFFDQLENIKRLETVLLQRLRLVPQKQLRVLDLCAYVGQWGAHLQETLAAKSVEEVSYTAVDVSEKALQFAQTNVNRAGERAKRVLPSFCHAVKTLKADVLEPIPTLASQSFQVVIADPPAFIKNRKSIPQGKQAYAQLFQTAIEKTAPGGLVIACSCSQLLSKEDFLEVLGKASRRSKRKVRWLTQGSPSFDHFARLDFEEGHYLKSFIGYVD